MIHDISWGQFLLYYGIILFLYYAFVLLKYYRKDIPRLLKSGRRAPKIGGLSSIHLTEEQFAQTFQELDEIVHDIRHKIVPACGNSPEQLLQELGQRLAHFRGIHVPAFKRVLMTKILLACEEKGIDLSEEELIKWWTGL